MNKPLKTVHHVPELRLGLLQKLLISFIVFIIIPLFVFSMLSYSHISQILLQQFKYSSEKSLQQTVSLLDKTIGDIISSTEQVVFSSTLSDILKEDKGADLSPKTYHDYSTVNAFVTNTLSSSDLYSSELFIDGSIHYALPESRGSEGITFIDLQSKEGQEFSRALDEHSGKILWLPPRVITNALTRKEAIVVSGVRSILDTVSYSRLGILSVNVRQEYLNSILSQSVIVSNGLTVLINDSNCIIAVSDQKLYDAYQIDPAELIDSINYNQPSFEVNNQEMMISIADLPQSDWRIVSMLPYAELLKTSKATRNRMIISMIIIAFLSIPLAYYLSALLTKRIRKLSNAMKDLRFSEFPTPIIDNGNDEVSDLINSYNHLLNRIDDYSHKQYQMGLELRSSELKALQAQINPHFLYNTLDLIRWIAEDYEAKEVSEIALLLSRFYKFSLNHGSDITTIKDAILHAETYVKLQNYRFDNCISLTIEVDPSIYNCEILNLLLQPIIENSIIHGIREKEIPSGSITISGNRMNEIIIIKITDDGIGIQKAQLDTLLDTTSVSGYGIKNVFQRIKLFYGDSYGLSYESIPGKGTIATLVIPYRPIPKKEII